MEQKGGCKNRPTRAERLARGVDPVASAAGKKLRRMGHGYHPPKPRVRRSKKKSKDTRRIRIRGDPEDEDLVIVRQLSDEDLNAMDFNIDSYAGHEPEHLPTPSTFHSSASVTAPTPSPTPAPPPRKKRKTVSRVGVRRKSKKT